MLNIDEPLLTRFREQLPNTHNREMWVNETILEYNRLVYLRDNGVPIRPSPNSLLDILLSLDPNMRLGDDTSYDPSAYQRFFGHAPTYCWTDEVSVLGEKSASGSSQPAVAWMNENDIC